jgi:hypothetical protein
MSLTALKTIPNAAVLNKSWMDMQLTVRAHDALAQTNLRSIKQLLETDPKDLLRMWGVGKKLIAELHLALRRLGFEWEGPFIALSKRRALERRFPFIRYEVQTKTKVLTETVVNPHDKPYLESLVKPYAVYLCVRFGLTEEQVSRTIGIPLKEVWTYMRTGVEIEEKYGR